MDLNIRQRYQVGNYSCILQHFQFARGGRGAENLVGIFQQFFCQGQPQPTTAQNAYIFTQTLRF